ncbi:MAG: H+/Cl- antiporter ClcA [Rickettsiales bacterium]
MQIKNNSILTQIRDNPVPRIFLIALTTLFVAILVEAYSGLFGQFGIMAKERLINSPVVAFITTPVLIWLAAYLCRRFSPKSSGGSLEYIKIALDKSKDKSENPKKVASFLSFHSAVFSLISSLIACFGGGGLGREAPSVFISASIFAGIAGKLKKRISTIHLQHWIFAGSAIGLTVAFNSPIAGLAYVIEKLLRDKGFDFRRNIFWTLIAILAFVIFLQKEHHLFRTEDLGFEFDIRQIALMILVAVSCGVFALGFKKATKYLHDRLIRVKSNYWHLIPITAGILIASISLYAGIHSFSGGILTASQAVNEEIILSYKEVFGRILNATITFASGAAGGLVAPSIAIGAGIASIIGGLFIWATIKILLLVGMASFLAVILGEPIAAAIVIYETTDQSVSSLPFLILGALIAVLVGKILKFLGVIFIRNFHRTVANYRRRSRPLKRH